MINSPSNAQLTSIPTLYSTEGVQTKNKVIQAHFFLGGCDWFIAEIKEDLMFGFCILNSDYEMAEWGYVSLEELKSIRVDGWLEVDFDCYWNPKPANQVEKICIAQGWPIPKANADIEIECPNCKKIIVSEADSSEVQCSECKIIILQRHINSTVHQEGLQWHIHQS